MRDTDLLTKETCDIAISKIQQVFFEKKNTGTNGNIALYKHRWHKLVSILFDLLRHLFIGFHHLLSLMMDSMSGKK